MGWGILPILAQTLTIAAADRAELRLVAERANESWDTRFEAEDAATLAAALTSSNSVIGLQYSPSVIVTPLEGTAEGERTIGVFHRLGAGAAITWRTSRRTTLIASQGATYELSNTRIQGLSNSASAPPSQGPVPPPDDGAPDQLQPPPDTGDARTTTVDTQTGSLRSQLQIDHRLSRVENVGAFIAYAFTSGLGDSRDDFPLIHGPDGAAYYDLRVSRRDRLKTIATGRYAFVETGDRAFVGSIGEEWEHLLSRNATLGLGAGVTYVYFDPVDGPAEHNVYFGTGSGAQISYSFREKWNGGIVTVSFGASYSPVLDQRTFRPDVRFGSFAGASWTRRRLTLYARTTAVLSAEPDDPGALNSVAAALGSIYELGGGFAFESGARAGWQTFRSETGETVEVLPASTALFVALSWGAELLRH